MKMWLAMRLMKKSELNIGLPVTFEDGGRLGVMPVYKTKTAARKAYGRKVELIEVKLADKADGE